MPLAQAGKADEAMIREPEDLPTKVEPRVRDGA